MTFPSETYDKAYWEKGKGSNYGGDRPEYTLQNYLPEKRKVANQVIELIGIPGRTMSLGCGRGYQVLAFKYLSIDAHGIDISKYAVETAPDEIKDSIFVGDISDNFYMMNNWGTKTFELVTAFDVLEHIKVPALYNAIFHSIRLSNKYIMINMPVKNIDDEPDESETSTDSTHVSIYTPQWWISQYLTIGRPLGLELRKASVTHNEYTYSLFAMFERGEEPIVFS